MGLTIEVFNEEWVTRAKGAREVTDVEAELEVNKDLPVVAPEATQEEVQEEVEEENA